MNDDHIDVDALCSIAEAKRRQGDVLDAFNLVQKGRAAGLRSNQFDYLLVRLTADLGDAAGALMLYDALALAAQGSVDAVALKGRILKDQAFRIDGESRRELLAEAGQCYASAHRLAGDHFPAINAASLMMMAGSIDAGLAMARNVRAATAESSDYWSLASHIEACLLLDDPDGLRTAIAQDALIGMAAMADRAATMRQFRRLAQAQLVDAALVAAAIDALTNPPVLIYCGHMFRAGCAAEAGLRRRIDTAIEALGATIAYGPLACGADIMIAEAMLARGGELNVVLPFRECDFIDVSVHSGGAPWEARYRACIEAATSVTHASESAYVGDDNQFAYGTRVAMGLATLRARQLEAEAVQLAVVTDEAAILPAPAIAGTRADIAQWQALGRRTVTVAAGDVDRTLNFPPVALPPDAPERGAWSILFADYKGFSRLDERQLPVFVTGVMGAIGEVLDRHGNAILFRNTWGDAIYVVIASPVIAARVAVELQARLADTPAELASDGADPSGIGMRIGVHHGPIFRGTDPVVNQPLWFGTEVTRTARIEPVTPTGAVYCTEAFAAMLALEPDESFSCNYVGRVPLAKGYGVVGMYRLN